MIPILRKEDGAVLVLSIIIIAVLITLITALGTSINSNISFTKHHEDKVKAFYAAEAGIEKGINLIINNEISITNEEEKLYSSSDDDNWNNNEYNLTILRSGNEYTIKSKGKNRDSIKTIISTIRIANNSPFSNAITSGGDIYFNGNEQGTIDGNIYANGSIVDLAEDSNLKINGEIIQGGEDIIPDFSNFFEEGHNTWSNYDSNKKDFPGGTMEIPNRALFDKLKEINGSGILVVQGGLTFKKHVKINKNKDDFLIILADGPVIFNKQVEGNFFLYSTDTITFNSGSGKSGRINMQGSLMAESNIITNVDMEIKQNDKFLDIFTDLGFDIPTNDSGSSNNKGNLEIESWEEVN